MSAIDVSVQAQVLNLMRELQDRRGLTYPSSLSVVKFVSDEVAELQPGRNVQHTDAEQLYRNP